MAKLLNWTAVLLLGLVLSVYAVDRSKFRTCAQTGFCKWNRDKVPEKKYQVLAGSVKANGDGSVHAQVGLDGEGPLNVAFIAYKEGVLRVRIVEPESPDIAPRYESPDILVEEKTLQSMIVSLEVTDESPAHFVVGSKQAGIKAKVTMNPFKVDVLGNDNSPIVTLNGRNIFHFEQREKMDAPKVDEVKKEDESKDEKEKKEIVDWGEDGKAVYADGSKDEEEESAEEKTVEPTQGRDKNAPESFGGHTDNKPLGPQSVGIDVLFPGAKHVYGIPEHASDFALKTTNPGGGGYDEPFRLFNLDVFEYEIDNSMALYGHIPVVIGHKKGQTTSVFWNNPSETFVDVTDQDGSKEIHWISETGIPDIMIMVGPTPSKVFRQYSSMTGTTPIPPLFSIAYHQCRWNYRDEKDVRDVNAEFEKYDFPYDVIWLDIEHTDGKRYFTWDKDKFPTPKDMQANIAHFGRRMITIVDPHIKADNDYYIHKEATDLGLYIKDKNGNSDFKGWCWPGDSSYLDFTHPKVRSWWADQFSYDRYQGSTDILYTWNDMNEPSVFNGPEVTMHKESLSLDKIEHREWHNLYGFYQHMATAEGLTRRSKNSQERPFVLSRAFYAGSQRHGAIWTGDNFAKWSHLKIASDMLLSLNVAGLPFAGADVGGFFENPGEELVQRWYQAGSFQPFFRAHAHIDTKRREPWVFGEEVMGRIAKAVKTRYTLLPFWYTVYHEHEVTGMPVMRPLWSLAPDDEETFAIGDEWLVGNDLLVKPVTDEGVVEANVYLPKGTAWYQFEHPHAFHNGGVHITESAPLDKIPVFQRAGSIVPRKMRLRRSSKTMSQDPYTFAVALDPATNVAHGSLYIDDEHTFAYKDGASCLVEMDMNGEVLKAEAKCGNGFHPVLDVERIVILGVDAKPSKIVVSGSNNNNQELSSQYDASARLLTIRKPTKGFMTVPFTVTLTK
uniref:Glucosidase II subunit alpha n=1 Tax=Mucochytrium quahogii TaxID=96639 RepID=A0A7S2SFF9_9STRA|mmetsp:Transcript_45146/g.72204  ORF Transcript_45146/g.72204 Transcript_45146/m.72204 type:complete len:949 (-) Transcript_45146:2700-5546(-)